MAGRAGVGPNLIDDLIVGCVDQVGEQRMNIVCRAVLAVDRQCGSSQQAVHFAAQGIQAGAYDEAIAAGVESISRVPTAINSASDLEAAAFAPLYPEGLVPQGISAETIAAKWHRSSPDVDGFSLQSRVRAGSSRRRGSLRP
jgi:acetyl-CoA acyltransferase